MSAKGRHSARESSAGQLEGDELFKEIGGELDSSNFDYSQWQRKASHLAKHPGSASNANRGRSARVVSAKKSTLPGECKTRSNATFDINDDT